MYEFIATIDKRFFIGSMLEFQAVKEYIVQMKEDIRGIEGIVQFTYNNTVDMLGLADQVKILVASHATLFALLKEMSDAKKWERSSTRYAKLYRPSLRTPPPHAPRSAPLVL